MIATKWAVSILAIALLARIGAVLAIGTGLHFADEAIYVDTAHRLSSGGGFGTEYSQVPAYPVFLALLSFGLPTGTTFLRVAQATVAALGSVLVFTLADRLFGRRAAIASALVYALDPLLVIASGLLYPEAIAALLVPLIVLATLDGSERDQLGRSALAGGLLGILTLLRPVALVLVPIVAAWATLAVTTTMTRRVTHLGLFAFAFALVLAPWAARNLAVRGQLTAVPAQGTDIAPVGPAEVSRDGLIVSVARWGWKNPEALLTRVMGQFLDFWELAPTRMATDNPMRREEFHRQDPRLEVQPLFSRRLRDLVSAGSFSLELCLALLGIIVAARTRRHEAVFLVALILAFAAGYALFVAKLRYRIPILPLLFLFTGAGTAAVYSFLERASRRSSSTPYPPGS